VLEQYPNRETQSIPRFLLYGRPNFPQNEWQKSVLTGATIKSLLHQWNSIRRIDFVDILAIPVAF
jgi:hypothetical protein